MLLNQAEQQNTISQHKSWSTDEHHGHQQYIGEQQLQQRQQRYAGEQQRRQRQQLYQPHTRGQQEQQQQRLLHLQQYTGKQRFNEMYSAIYFRNKTTTDSNLNETSLGEATESFISASSPSAEKDDSGGSSLAPTPSLRLLLRWYSLIAILSVLVVSAILFAVCRLSLKAEAFRKSGMNSQQDSLLFSDCKASSALPISIDLDDSSDL